MTISDIEAFLSDWAGQLDISKAVQLKDDLQKEIETIKKYLGSPNAAENRESIYTAAIFLRGLYDYIQIHEVIDRDGWERSTELLDYVWVKYWDCKDRFDFSQSAIPCQLATNIAKSLCAISQFYRDNFGEGLYMSPDILIKLELCSICGEDIRDCAHVRGRFYGETICRGVVREPVIRSVSIVKNPHDPRCRMWPWNFNQSDNTFEGAVITLFQIDDFLYDDKWTQTRQPPPAANALPFIGLKNA